MGDRTIETRNQERANALPFLGDVKDESVETEPTVGKDQGFTAIIKIFARTWPFLRTYIHGYWREFPANGTAATDDADNGQWSYAHVPPLVTLLAAAGPVSGLVPYGETWLYDFLVISAGILAALSWGLLIAKGRLYGIFSAALAGIAAVAFLFAVFAVDGQIDNVYMFFVVAACACIWALQFRREPGRIRFRIRLGSHLVYYFVLVWASSLLLLLIALFSVDVISQSILQAKPLTPFVADLISKPELAVQLPEDGKQLVAPALFHNHFKQ